MPPGTCRKSGRFRTDTGWHRGRRRDHGRPVPHRSRPASYRLQTPVDQFLIETQRALETVFGSPRPAAQPSRRHADIALDAASAAMPPG